MRFKKAFSLCLSLALLAGTVAGCANSSSSSSEAVSASSAAASSEEPGIPDYLNPVGEYPITKELTTVTAMVSANSDTMSANWNDLTAFQRLEKKTNIHFEFEYVNGGTNNEQFKTQLALKMAGSDYPEVILMGMTSEQEESFGPSGKWIDLTNLIAQYAPNLTSLIESNDEVKYGIKAMDGKIYGLPYYVESVANVPTLSFFNSEWMKNVGITELPKTTDDLYALLQAFKTKDANGNGDPNDEIPFSCVGVGYLELYLQSAFQGYAGCNTSGQWDVDDSGKVVYLPQEKGFKEYLEFCHNMYVDGLLDNEFISQTSDQEKAKVKANLVGFYNMSPTIVAGTEMADQKQICLEPLTSPTNSKKVSVAPINLTTTAGVITSNCEHPEAAMRWFDMWYATEDKAVDGFWGNVSLMGYEGENWKYTDASKTSYEFIAPTTTFTDLNKTTIITYGLPSFVKLTAYISGNQLLSDKIEESKEKLEPYYRSGYPAAVRYSADEATEAATMSNDLFTYVRLMQAKFITGEESLDNFDKFLTELDKYRVEDLKALKQAAYDRYIAAKG